MRLDILWAVPAIVLGLVNGVVVHELGHVAAATMDGQGVEAIGFRVFGMGDPEAAGRVLSGYVKEQAGPPVPLDAAGRLDWQAWDAANPDTWWSAGDGHPWIYPLEVTFIGSWFILVWSARSSASAG